MTHQLHLSSSRCVQPCKRYHRRQQRCTTALLRGAATPAAALPAALSLPPTHSMPGLLLATPSETTDPPSPLHPNPSATADVNHAKAFVKALRRCSSLADLHLLLQHYQPHLDSQAISAAASFYSDTMAGRSSCQAPGARPLQQSMRRTWLPLFMQQLPRMDAVGLCICVQSAAKVSRGLDYSHSHSTPNHYHMPLLDELALDSVLEAADAQMPAFTSRSAAQLLWGLTALGCQPPAPWLARFLSTAAPARSLPSASPQDLVMLLWCLAKLRTMPPEPWLRQLMQAAAPQLPSFDGQQVGMLMWALSALGIRPGGRFVTAAVERATGLLELQSRATEQRHRPQEQRQQPSSQQQGAVYADASDAGEAGGSGLLGSSSAHDQEPSSCSGSEGSYRGGQASGPQACALAASVGNAASRQAASSGEWTQQPCRQQGCPGPPRCTCSVLSAHHAHQRASSSHLLGSSSSSSNSSSSRNGSRSSSSNSSSSRNGSSSSSGLDGTDTVGPAPFQLPNRRGGVETNHGGVGNSHSSARPPPVFAAAAVAQLCHALLMLDLQPGAAFCQAVLAGTVEPGHTSSALMPRPDPHPEPQLVPGMGLREALLLLMGLARWRCTPDARWRQALLRSTAAQLPQASERELAGVLWGLAQLSIRPPAAWMQAAEERLLEVVPQLSPLSTARCLVAFGYLRYTPRPLLAAQLLHLLCTNMDKVAAKKLFPAILAAATLKLPIPARQLRVLVQGPAHHHKWHYCSLLNLAQHAYALVQWGVQPGAMWCVQLLEAAEDKLKLPAAEPSVKELLLMASCVAQLLCGLTRERLQGQGEGGVPSSQQEAAQAFSGSCRGLVQACMAQAGEMTQPQLTQLTKAGAWLGLGPAELSKLHSLSASLGVAAEEASWGPGLQAQALQQMESTVCARPLAS